MPTIYDTTKNILHLLKIVLTFPIIFRDILGEYNDHKDGFHIAYQSNIELQ